MSDDDFMLVSRRAPSAALARRLRVRLAELDAEPSRVLRHAPPLRWAAGVVAVLVLGAAFALPSFRAGAQAFLDLFRVVNFAPVAVQTGRLETLLGRQQIDLPKILGEEAHALGKPAPWQAVSGPDAAGALAGMPISLPAWRPAGFEVQRVEVLPSRAWRFTASARKLQGVLDSLGIHDVSVPAALDGQVITASAAPIVRISYGSGSQRFALIESRQPIVSIPQGIDLTHLADIALRVLGVGGDEAYQLSQGLDWRTTLIVPIPADAAAFRQVNVQGHSGLLVVSVRRSARSRLPGESRLIWSTADRVFALIGNLPPAELFDMAQSLQ